MPDITGSFTHSTTANYTTETGAFSKIQGTAQANAGNAYTGQYGAQFKASKSNSIYGSSTTVQPPSITLIPQIRY